MKIKERYYCIDWMKVLAIFCVLFYHTYKVDTDFLTTGSLKTYFHYFFSAIFATAVPLFFMINGFLLLGKPFDLNKHLRKMRNLFVLTIFWDILCCISELIIFNKKTTIIGFFFMVQNSDILWFLRALFVIYVFFPMMKISFDNNRKVFSITLVLFCIFTFLNKFLVMLANIMDYIFCVDSVAINYNFFDGFDPMKGIYGFSLVYFMLGGLLHNAWNKEYTRKWDSLATVMLIGGWLLLFGYGILYSVHIDEIHDPVFAGYGELFTCLMVVSIFYFFSKYINTRLPSLFQQIAQNTLGIYCVQWPVVALVNINFGHQYSGSLLLNFCVAACTLLICNTLVSFGKKVPLLKEAYKM